jgi:NADH-quinone oxidoreductase subunit M
MPDLSWREIAVFAPILFMVLWMGIYPSSFLRPMQPALASLVERVDAAHRAALLSTPTNIASR